MVDVDQVVGESPAEADQHLVRARLALHDVAQGELDEDELDKDELDELDELDEVDVVEVNILKASLI